MTPAALTNSVTEQHLVSIATQEPDYPGFMITHSFPRTPVDLYTDTPKGVPVVFKWVNGDYPQKRFQDIVCTHINPTLIRLI